MSRRRWDVPPRLIAPVALVLGLTIAAFFGARVLGERGAQRESARRAEVAAAQIRGRVEQAGALAESLRRFMVSSLGRDVTSEAFVANASRWLSPAGFPAAAWVEPVPAVARGAYERRTGQPIVTRDRRLRIVPAGSRRSYLPATLVSGVPPMAAPGIDLGGESGMTATLARATAQQNVAATPLTTLRDGMSGLFLVRSAPRLASGAVRPGFVVVFVSDGALSAAPTNTGAVRLTTGDTSIGAPVSGGMVHRTFTEAGQRFDVAVSRDPVHGAAEAVPWIILGAGVVLAGLVGALGVTSGRRARARAEVDRLFTLSSDLITVAGFDGYWKRVNPAFERRMGFTEREALARPYLEFVHPDDREQSATQARLALEGKTVLAFENRMACKNGSYRAIEWTATPVPEEGVLFGVGRDVTERRQAETELARVVGEQAALRRVATLVARGAPQGEIFTAIAKAVGELFGTEEIRMLRFDDDRSAVVVAGAGEQAEAFPVGARRSLEGDNVTARVFRTERAVRMDEYETASGPIAEAVRPMRLRSVVGTPIVVEGRLWGALAAGTRNDEQLPPETESRLSQFTKLMATAIGNTESRARAQRLTEEQAALRRVAMLVASEPSPAEVFAKVVEELAQVLVGVDSVLLRDEGDGTVSSVAVAGDAMSATFPVGTRLPVDGDGVTASVLRDGRPRRIDDYSQATGTIAGRGREHGMRSAVGCPVVVRGRSWGVLGVARFEGERLAPDTETRITQFSELVATAVANAGARAEVERLADEQAALRRVATLVAQGAAPTAVFGAVAGEMERLLDADQVALSRYEPGDEVTVVAFRGLGAASVPPGTRMRHHGESVTQMVRRTEQVARITYSETGHGAIAERARRLGLRVAVGAPVVVDGRLWGVVQAGWTRVERRRPDTEQRMAQFAQLLDTAIANADSRDQLNASRARLLTAADEARRRVVRDLHDGAQQRLVQTILTLRVAQQSVREHDDEAESLIDTALEQAERGVTELRELAHGLLPASLTRGGLRAAVGTVVSRLEVPVDVEVPAERFAPEIEASAYFVVAEALTNVVKHAHAAHAEVRASVNDGSLHIHVRDDGIGGADPGGHGLVGMSDRVTALGGRLEISSPTGGGTVLAATLPLAAG